MSIDGYCLNQLLPDVQQPFCRRESYSIEGGADARVPLAMAMFGLATLPLIQRIKNANTTQCWFADDAAAGARLLCLRHWWDSLTKVGPKFGYFPNGIKTYLVTKPDKVDEATELFSDTDVHVTCAGRRYLGGALGTEAFEQQFLEAKIWE